MQGGTRRFLSRALSAVSNAARRTAAAVESLVWPKGCQCLCCERLSYGKSLCTECQKNLNDLRLKHESGDLRSAWKYAGSAKALVTALKYNCNGDCAPVLAEGIADVIRHMPLPPDTILTWVTMPKKRMRDRGIDHGQELCRCVSRITGISMRQLLQRSAGSKTQRGLNKEQRLQNLQSAFTCKEPISGAVLLVDDVLTTGTTIRVCTQALLEGGASHVYTVTATKAEMNHN